MQWCRIGGRNDSSKRTRRRPRDGIYRGVLENRWVSFAGRFIGDFEQAGPSTADRVMEWLSKMERLRFKSRFGLSI